MRINGTSYISSIKLGDGGKVPTQVQVLRTGKFKHPSYGDFEISTKVLADMKANFDAKVRGVDMAIDYFHESDKEAAGWVSELQLREGNTELWAVVEWTPKATQKLSEREIRYFSPDFSFKWTDPEKGLTFENVLFGGGVTNRPFVKEMAAIVANENEDLEYGEGDVELGGPGSGRRPGGGGGAKKESSSSTKSKPAPAAAKPAQQVEREKAEKDYQDFHAEMRAKYGANEDERQSGLGDRLNKVMTPAERTKAEKVRADRLRTASHSDRNAKGPAEKANENTKGVHKVEPTYSKDMGISHGKSHAGILTRGASRDKDIAKLRSYNQQKTSAAKTAHKDVLEQLRSMPKANIKGLSEKYLKLKGEKMTDLEKAQARVKELEADNIKLSESNVELSAQLEAVPPAPPANKVAELEAKIAELQAELAKAKGEAEVMAAEKQKADEAKMLAEKENKFNVLLSEGKACAAQKDAFLKGDMSDFIAKAQPVNTKGVGSSQNSNVTLDEKQASIIKLADEKQKADPKLDRGSAVSQAKKEIEAKK